MGSGNKTVNAISSKLEAKLSSRIEKSYVEISDEDRK
jgi:hypothetical protein